MALVMASLSVSGEPARAAMCAPTTLADALPDIYGEPTTTTAPAETTPTEAPAATTEAATDTTATTEATESTEPATTTTTIAPEPCTPFYKRIHAPLPGRIAIGSGFAADRDGGTRHHTGIDLPAPRMTPVLAVADGTITRIGDGNCCTIRLRHRDGWESSYVHLNNDRWGTDDGLGSGIVPGLEVGDRVRAGQVIGYVGDSTNAEETVPHLHFSLRMPDGTAIDAGESIRRATRIAWFSGAFADDDGSPTEHFIDRAASVAGVVACDDDGIGVCPDQPLTAEAAERLVAAVTGHVVDAPVALTPVGFGLAPELPPLSGADLRSMIEEAIHLDEIIDLPFGELPVLADVADPEPGADQDEHVLSVGCLWQPPADDAYPTLAESVVAVLVAWGDAVAPECAFDTTAP
jgi:murein DD-endopeptidase MepM/ murein hydrolase activator NlpD